MSRLTSPVPKFWRKVQWIALILGGVLGAVWGVVSTVPEINKDIILYLQIGIAICGVIAAEAQFTTTDRTP